MGTHVHNIELNVGTRWAVGQRRRKLCQLMAKEGKYAQIKLPSGEVRMVLLDCKATIGQVGNLDMKTYPSARPAEKDGWEKGPM